MAMSRATADLDLVPDPELGGLDVIQLASGIPGYSQLAEAAVESDVLGIPARICSLGDLREMKQAQDRAQDRADLENLPEKD
jgi:hypothetical protein